MRKNEVRMTKRKINRIKRIIAAIIGVVAAIYILYHELFPSETAQQASVSETDVKCVDGDTFWMGETKIRLLAIDTPESTTTVEEYGKAASKRTCDLLNEGRDIVFYFDEGNETDKYGRKLYWVYIDGAFLQETLISEGLAEIKYVDKKTVDQARLNVLEKAQSNAKSQALGIWSLTE